MKVGPKKAILLNVIQCLFWLWNIYEGAEFLSLNFVTDFDQTSRILAVHGTYRLL